MPNLAKCFNSLRRANYMHVHCLYFKIQPLNLTLQFWWNMNIAWCHYYVITRPRYWPHLALERSTNTKRGQYIGLCCHCYHFPDNMTIYVYIFQRVIPFSHLHSANRQLWCISHQKWQPWFCIMENFTTQIVMMAKPHLHLVLLWLRSKKKLIFL